MYRRLINLIAFILIITPTFATKDRDTIKIMAGDSEIIIIKKKKSKQEQIEDLKAGSEDFTQKIEELQQKIDSLQQKIEQANSILDTINIDSIKIVIKHNIDEWKLEIEDYQKFIEALEKGLEDINKQIEELSKDFQDTIQPKISDETIESKKQNKKFKPHFCGIELGFNSFLDENQNILSQPSNNIFAPQISQSYTIGWNFIKQKLPITNFAGFVLGLGIEWNSFYYKDFPYYDYNNFLIYPDSLHSQYDQNGELSKILLKTSTLKLPLNFEIQLPNHREFYISAGAFAFLRLNTTVKYVYIVNNTKSKIKDKVYGLSTPYGYGLNLKLGLGNIHLFMNYYLTPIFSNKNNPLLYPISFGIFLN